MKTYEDGLNEAWEMAKRIACLRTDGGESAEWLQNVFGDSIPAIIIAKHSASEAIKQVKEYEEIKVGDEVIDSNGMLEKRSVVVRVSGSVITIIEGDGTASRWEKEGFKKTGRHFSQIEEVLKQMQEGNE